jgi:uncharacterized protein DUF1837
MKLANLKDVATWFSPHTKPDGSIEVRAQVLDDDKTKLLEDFMVREIPDCYISTIDLVARTEETGLAAPDILKNKLPDPGSIMSGDFGEVVTLFFLGSESNKAVTSVKKWRYKQDRKKPAPHSDVILLYREDINNPSKKDFVICAESKAKATHSTFRPIEKSIQGYVDDKTGRLARTLVWLKEKAIDNEDSEYLKFITRFADDLVDIEFSKKYRAVAIIDTEYLDDELVQLIDLPVQGEEFEVIVLGITDLKKVYERSFSRAVGEVTCG